MPIITRSPGPSKPWLHRIGWFALIYAGSFCVVVGGAYVLKAVIPH